MPWPDGGAPASGCSAFRKCPAHGRSHKGLVGIMDGLPHPWCMELSSLLVVALKFVTLSPAGCAELVGLELADL